MSVWTKRLGRYRFILTGELSCGRSVRSNRRVTGDGSPRRFGVDRMVFGIHCIADWIYNQNFQRHSSLLWFRYFRFLEWLLLVHNIYMTIRESDLEDWMKWNAITKDFLTKSATFVNRINSSHFHQFHWSHSALVCWRLHDTLAIRGKRNDINRLSLSSSVSVRRKRILEVPECVRLSTAIRIEFASFMWHSHKSYD